MNLMEKFLYLSQGKWKSYRTYKEGSKIKHYLSTFSIEVHRPNEPILLEKEMKNLFGFSIEYSTVCFQTDKTITGSMVAVYEVERENSAYCAGKLQRDETYLTKSDTASDFEIEFLDKERIRFVMETVEPREQVKIVETIEINVDDPAQRWRHTRVTKLSTGKILVSGAYLEVKEDA